MKQLMNLNKETALRLWVQQFGRKQKATDFSGREIAKAAYNDRNSNYGWNVDHILPLVRGGKTADYNLICCHILTNDEKADRFPCFKANEKEFNIQKRQNHYEIIESSANRTPEEDESVNFLDAAQGLECWKLCKPDNRYTFVGYVKIRVVISNSSNQLMERYEKFLIELFGVDSVFVEEGNTNNLLINRSLYNREFIFTVIVGKIPTKKDTQNLLDDCVILNTYSIYFTNCTGFEDIRIVCGMECYDSLLKMSLQYKKDIVDKQVCFNDNLAINDLVKKNTDAEKHLKNISSHNGVYSYNFLFSQLEKNLKKYI